jgi:hypothetical protein
MEETSGAVVVEPPFGQAPFRESPFGELISEWLDEGDRLSASAAAVAAPSSAAESRLRHVLQRVQPVFARYRLLVLAAIGMLPLTLILGTHRRAPAQPPTATVAVAMPVVALAGHESRPVPSPQAQSAPVPMLTWAATAMARPASAALASAGAEPTATPHRHHHHHHHHHHAANAPSKTVASAAPATRR